MANEAVQEMNEQMTDVVTDYKYGFVTDHKNIKDTGKGLTEEIIREISTTKNEPEWMLAFRLKAYAEFLKQQMPT